MDDSKRLNLEHYLKGCHGTAFKHYWFQKLEYVLWKNWENRNEPAYKNYRITSKNSVEHIFPQNHEFKEKLEVNYLNSFGNLGLLSVSQNSSYSNQDVKKKKVDFDKKVVYDSLKLALIYNDATFNNWNEARINSHQLEMIDKLTEHYNSNPIPSLTNEEASSFQNL